MTAKKTGLIIGLFAALMFLAGTASALTAVSQMGYHPNSHKKAIVYTGNTGGTFSIINANTGNAAASYPLAKPKNSDGISVNCQGGMQCLIGDFSSFGQQGTFYIQTPYGNSPEFQIDSNLYSNNAPTLLEFFQATLQQDSAYHEDLHKAQNPSFPMMADGSFLMVADQAALTLIRLGSAYNRNPGAVSSDNYFITNSGQPDIREYILKHVEYLEILQDHDGTLAVSRGWVNNFQCPFDFKPSEERWNSNPNPCMNFESQTSNLWTSQTLLAYLEAIPAVQDMDSGRASSLLGRAINTYDYLKNKGLNQEEAGFVGASAFLLYDYTGNLDYLREAYSYRDRASSTLDSSITHASEFYWEEYMRHKMDIEGNGFFYGNPEQKFIGKLIYDYEGRNPTISGNGEKVYVHGGDFQHSRSMIIEALMALKANEQSSQEFLTEIAESQIAWVTGSNAIQDGDWDGPKKSLSFIFGIGDNPNAFHSRLVPQSFHESGSTMTFQNGKEYIPGWISGAYDSSNDGDAILNHHDYLHAWRYTETTNEIVAAGLELFAYLDAYYDGTNSPPKSELDPVDPDSGGSDSGSGDGTDGDSGSGTGDACVGSVENIQATCSGTITSDTFDGCRHITCSENGNSMTILACNKPDGATPEFFEMYRQSGSGVEICLGDSCISESGYSLGTFTCDGSSGGDTGTGDSDGDAGVGDSNGDSGSGDGTTDSGSGDACYSSLKDMPVTCDGNMDQDTFDGCRNLRCVGTTGTLSVLACEKPDVGMKTHFEIYRQSQSGTPPEICIAGNCIKDQGYVKSGNYPVCTGSGSDSGGSDSDQGENGGSDSGDSGTSGDVNLKIKEWYPKGKDYIFVCETGFGANTYDWDFGDGSSWAGSSRDNVYHTYSSPGTVTVSCTAQGGGSSGSDSIQITVS